MTLKLVSNVEDLSVNNLMDIGGMARRFAEEVEAGRHGDDIVSVTVLIETTDRLKRESWGELPSTYELIGILAAAQMGVFEEENE